MDRKMRARSASDSSKNAWKSPPPSAATALSVSQEIIANLQNMTLVGEAPYDYPDGEGGWIRGSTSQNGNGQGSSSANQNNSRGTHSVNASAVDHSEYVARAEIGAQMNRFINRQEWEEQHPKPSRPEDGFSTAQKAFQSTLDNFGLGPRMQFDDRFGDRSSGYEYPDSPRTSSAQNPHNRASSAAEKMMASIRKINKNLGYSQPKTPIGGFGMPINRYSKYDRDQTVRKTRQNQSPVPINGGNRGSENGHSCGNSGRRNSERRDNRNTGTRHREKLAHRCDALLENNSASSRIDSILEKYDLPAEVREEMVALQQQNDQFRLELQFVSAFCRSERHHEMKKELHYKEKENAKLRSQNFMLTEELRAYKRRRNLPDYTTLPEPPFIDRAIP